MARLHTFSRTYSLTDHEAALRHDTHTLAQNIDLLRTSLPMTLLAPQDVTTISAAGKYIAASMSQLGYERDVWGPVHGDLHYDNLLFYEDEIRPIDFPGLRLAHYLYDIGVTLYHTFHQGVGIREAFFVGYQQFGPLPSAYAKHIERFIAYAALDNIAWNSTIPAQLETPLFQRNVHQLVEVYCTPVAQGKSFLFH
jgi:Ser/Thr protein kinase RdoA (MazF antagonist)